MNLGLMNETLTKLWKPSIEAYVASPRFCRKHFDAKYKELIKEEAVANYEVVSLMGMCEKCDKLTQVHYLSPMFKSGTKEQINGVDPKKG